MDGDQGVTADSSFDDRLNHVVNSLVSEDDDKDPNASSADPASQGEGSEDAAPGANLDPSGKTDADKTKPLEGQDPKDPAKAGTPAAIEAPASWPSDDKQAFADLPTWAQETIVRRENDREAAFSQRSRSLSEQQRVSTDVQRRSEEAQARYLSEADRLNQVAAQLLPAKFSDIKTEADYLQLKVKDPQRASEYEAFTHVLRNANAQAAAARTQAQQAHLNREFTTLQDKYPEFKEPEKAKQIMGDVRKACVEWYGFQPQEVEIVADHRHVQIIRDAIAWRNYQAQIKSAAAKKAVPQQRGNLRPQAASGASATAEQKAQIRNRVGNAKSDREKADLIAGLL